MNLIKLSAQAPAPVGDAYRRSLAMPGISPDLTLILNAYRAHGGLWYPCTPGASAYLERCPLMCGAGGGLFPAGYAADWGVSGPHGGLAVSCLNGCRQERILAALGLWLDPHAGRRAWAGGRIVVTRGTRRLTLVA